MNTPKSIAFYLPQFHPVKENSEWWGPGFTEWTNVSKAKPNFEGHYQPHIPRELGFYDLRLPEVMHQQAELASKYGIYGFCFYWYWFGGRRILEKPIEVFFQNNVKLPFCFCWANENWTRTWDGLERNVLLGQNHSPEDDNAFLESMLPYFKDDRYIKVEGKPMLLVYRVDLFPDMRATTDRWREIAIKAGFPGLHICAVQFYGIDDPHKWGCDAAVEFPPHKFLDSENSYREFLKMSNNDFRGAVADYRKIVAQSLARDEPEYRLYRGIIPSWDNTARRQNTPHIIVESSPELYQYWLANLSMAAMNQPKEHQFVFINAWNEWAEGCHLEPDLRYGLRYLEATYMGLKGIAPSKSQHHAVVRRGNRHPDPINICEADPKEIIGLAQENRLLRMKTQETELKYLRLVVKVLKKVLRPARPLLIGPYRYLKSVISA